MAIERLAQLSAESRVVTDVTAPLAILPSIASAQARTGFYSYLLAADAVQFGVDVAVPASAYRLGYWLRHAELGMGSNGCLYRAANGVSRFESANILIRIDTVANTLDLLRPAVGTTDAYQALASVALPAALAVASVWLHVGILHYIHASEGFLSLYLNGLPTLTYSGDTRLYGQGDGTPLFATTAASIWGAGNTVLGSDVFGPADNYVDDFFLESYVGGGVAPVPMLLFAPSLPTGAGANAQWTPLSGLNWANVDDNPNDGNSTYNHTLVALQRDSFVYSDIVVPADHILRAVLPHLFAVQLDERALNAVRVHAFDGLNYLHSPDLALPTTYAVPLFARFELQPDGSPWNGVDANLMQFGYESR